MNTTQARIEVTELGGRGVRAAEEQEASKVTGGIRPRRVIRLDDELEEDCWNFSLTC